MNEINYASLHIVCNKYNIDYNKVSAVLREYLARNKEIETQGLTEIVTYENLKAMPYMAEGLENIKPTDLLVDAFAEQLKQKLRAAEQKHGWKNKWLSKDIYEFIITDMHTHIQKGDPLDVAAYCAFLWHHGWKTKHPDAATCDHGHYSPRVHGRVCTCGKMMTDFGD